MRKRYAVIFDRWNGRSGCSTSQVVARRSTKGRAVALAQRLGDRHPSLRVTRALYHRSRSGFEVRDLRSGEVVWEHPGVVIPSVGELGYW